VTQLTKTENLLIEYIFMNILIYII